MPSEAPSPSQVQRQAFSPASLPLRRDLDHHHPAQRLHVHLVDSDSARRATIARDLYANSIHVEIYENLDELLDSAPTKGFVLAQADQSDVDEARFIGAVRERVGYLPVAFYSAQPLPEKIVGAMLAGAIDYAQWPCAAEGFNATVMRVARIGEERTRFEQRKCNARHRVEALTQREREVLVRVIEGDSNKEIAQRLAISPRTVEIHRGNMLARLEARSTAEAVRIGVHSGLVD
jgi:two-component system response regulator FixJ